MASNGTGGLPVLGRQLDWIDEELPNYTRQDRFVLWFLFAYVVGESGQAQDALVNESGDKGVDAIHFDDRAGIITIVQGKLHETPRPRSSAADTRELKSLAELPGILTAGKPEFDEFLEDASPRVKKGLRRARRQLLAGSSRLRLCFASTGAITQPTKATAVRRARRLGADYEVFDRKRILELLDDYLIGVAPVVAEAELPLDGAGIISREDRPHGVSAYVATVEAKSLVDLYKTFGARIFARNVRGFLGDKGNEVNQSILQSARDEPRLFWYLNNGVTIACKEAEVIQKGTRHRLRIREPQIINGQQTTRSLAECDELDGIRVLARVVTVSGEHSESLVSRIVRATNHQTAVDEADLRSNDERQVSLERGLRTRHYIYLRKKMKKKEAHDLFGRSWPIIDRAWMARSIAACELDPAIARRGAKVLFADKFYDEVFPPDRGTDYFLSRYLLCELVRRRIGRKDPVTSYAYLFIATAVWKEIWPEISHRQAALIRVLEKPDQFPEAYRALERLTSASQRATRSFFASTRGTGADRIEFYAFFRREDQYERFVAFRPRLPTTVRSAMRDASRKFAQEFAKVT